MENKKVSIVITCYNKEQFIAETVESALSQTYENIEIVIIDDKSTDRSADVILKYAKKYKNILYISSYVNHGVVYSRNMAIDASSGDYILPLDADDTINPTFVEKAVKVLNENPEVGVVYCKYKIFGDETKFVDIPEEFSSKYILFSSCISATSMFRKKDFIKVGKYNENMNNIGCEDWDLWLSFAEKGYKFHLLNEYLLNYRKIKISESRTNIQDKNSTNILKQMIKNHFNYYLDNEDFLNSFKKNDEQRIVIEHLKKKKTRYLKLFQAILYFSIFEFFVILILCIVKNIFGG